MLTPHYNFVSCSTGERLHIINYDLRARTIAVVETGHTTRTAINKCLDNYYEFTTNFVKVT